MPRSVGRSRSFNRSSRGTSGRSRSSGKKAAEVVSSKPKESNANQASPVPANKATDNSGVLPFLAGYILSRPVYHVDNSNHHHHHVAQASTDKQQSTERTTLDYEKYLEDQLLQSTPEDHEMTVQPEPSSDHSEIEPSVTESESDIEL